MPLADRILKSEGDRLLAILVKFADEHSFSDHGLCTFLHVSGGTVGSLRRGDINSKSYPSYKTAKAICKTLNIVWSSIAEPIAYPNSAPTESWDGLGQAIQRADVDMRQHVSHAGNDSFEHNMLRSQMVVLHDIYNVLLSIRGIMEDTWGSH